jgi:hypothetical protein
MINDNFIISSAYEESAPSVVPRRSFASLLVWFVSEDSKKSVIVGRYAKIVDKFLKKNKHQDHEDLLESYFNIHLNLNLDFLSTLKLFDIVHPKCFKSSDDISEALVELCEYYNRRFVVREINHVTTTMLSVTLEVCHEGNTQDCIRAIRKNKI